MGGAIVRLPLTASLLAVLVLFPATGRATMIVRSYDPAVNDRFYVGEDKAFVGDPYDFSGVGYSNGARWVTLVSDNCFLSATHFHPGVGESVTFWDTNVRTGPSFSYTVTGGVQVGSTDLWVGWFDGTVTVDTSIARYPVLVLPSASDYLGLGLYNYGVDHRVGRNVLDDLAAVTVGGATGLTAWYDYDNNDVPAVGGAETYLEPGDSGAPTFTVFNSNLAMIGTHWAITDYPVIDGASSLDTFVPEYLDEISGILAGRGQAVISVPEPSACWSLLLGLGCWCLRRRRF